jgi:hypothetical protein
MTLAGMRQPIEFPRVHRRHPDPVHHTSGHPWLVRFARFGFVVRGIIYFLPGLLALELATGRHGRATTPAGAIDVIAQQPFGRALLLVMLVGLAGYAGWGVVRAVFDPMRRGHSPVGLAQRFGFVTSAIAYAGLFVATAGYLLGSFAHVETVNHWTVGVMAHPGGAILVGVVGLCWVFGSGIAQIVDGWRANFTRDLDLGHIGPGERRWAIRLGRVALIARGAVFTIIGLLLLAASLHLNSRGEGGQDGALLELTHHTFGRVLLGAAGAGLMAFGMYSAMCARWMRMHRTGGEPAGPSSPPISQGARYDHA